MKQETCTPNPLAAPIFLAIARVVMYASYRYMRCDNLTGAITMAFAFQRHPRLSTNRRFWLLLAAGAAFLLAVLWAQPAGGLLG